MVEFDSTNGDWLMVEAGEIEIVCPGCGHQTVHQLIRIQPEEDFVCAGCGQPVAVEAKQLSRAIAQTQKALNATIRGIKRRPG
jgi:transcription elongation factor Elf1